MSVVSTEYERVCVVQLKNDLSGDESAEARKAVEESMQQNQIVDFIIDLSGCSFIDSSGLETLLWAKQRAEQMFGKMKLINVDDNCRKILEITRLDSKFECCGDLASALKTMR
ncbi:MAG TPA: STAS domain-containing protein [Tepidisphaeraceae bacterium]|nr:STAS domain-containing protein [Tepidisphaeraceae bacterium]